MYRSNSVLRPEAAVRRALLVASIAMVLLSQTAPVAPPDLGGLVSVIVREAPGEGSTPEAIVAASGGEVTHRLGIIDGFSALVPATTVEVLAALPSVLAVTPDASITLAGQGGGGSSSDFGDLDQIRTLIKANRYWAEGYHGDGVGIALIDSGVVPVDGLTVPGKVINGPDLSLESQIEELRYLDTFGHGTHMASIMAGRDDGVVWDAKEEGWSPGFVGVAPEANIISVKVANALGATDVSQVLAAIDWVVQHRNDDGLNIRVMNLSFGAEPMQSYVLDPLAYAAEVAWRKGIFVVVAAGNNGNAYGRLNNPAFNPRLFAVGASVTQNSTSVSDDVIPTWSSRGDGTRNPDLVAPGRSVKGLRAPGSFIDQEHPEGRVGSRFFRGSGTSQAAAIVSGAAALVIEQRPTISPDQLKRLLKTTTNHLPAADPTAQGAGMISLGDVVGEPTPSVSSAEQSHEYATGLGSLDAARGRVRVEHDGDVLSGEQDIFGNAWVPKTWAADSMAGASWSGGEWNGASWSGASWSGASWSGASWSGASWSGASWSGASWSGASWSGASWSGASWSGASWSGASWS